MIEHDDLNCRLCDFVVRGGKRKLTSAEDNVNAEVAENNSKTDGKLTETKRPKRQAAALDKVKVIESLQIGVVS